MEARAMVEASANPQAFRWSRVATMAAVLLIHAGFVILLLLPVGAWRWRGTTRSSPRSDALSLRFMAMPSMPPPRARAKALPHVHATTPIRRPRRVVSVAVPKPQPRLAASASVPLAPADDTRSTQPSYIAGGGRFAADPGFTRDNVHLPGSSQPVHGMPVFHMVDPKTQGLAGVVRRIGGIFGAVNPHCVDVDVWRNMTRPERIAHHISAEQIDDVAERNGCIPPESGADRYHH